MTNKMRMRPGRALAASLVTFGGLAIAAPASAQSIGFGPSSSGKPVPVSVNADQRIVWNQKQRTVTAIGHAKAVRGDVTVTAERLVAHYAKRKAGNGQAGNGKAGGATGAGKAAAKPAASGGKAAQSGGPLAALDSGQSKLTELEAIGDVHIFTRTDQAFGDHAIYRMKTGDLTLTGRHVKFVTPTEVITAKKSLNYYPGAHKARAEGDATIVTKDHRSIKADTLIGWFRPKTQAEAAGGGKSGDADSQKLRKVIAEGHVIVRTAEDIATGDHGVYRPSTGIAVLTGHVHITRGPNELAGEKAVVNMKTGIATLAAGHSGRVRGLILPNSTPPSAPESPQSKGKAKP